MTRPEALLEVNGLTRGLPPGTTAERAGKAAERLAAHEHTDVLRGMLVELALQRLVEEARGAR